MSYDRVLPNPVALRYESAQVGPRPSNLLEHKIMNDLPTVMMRYPDGPVGPSIRYSDARSTGGSQTQQMALNEAKEAMSNGPVKPVGPMLSTKELPMRDRSDRSSSSSASSTSPVKSKENTMQFCLCQPDPKIPRPRNGESISSASSELGKCFFDCFFFGPLPDLIFRARRERS